MVLLGVDGSPTLEGLEVVTLGGGKLDKILVSSCKIITFFIFFYVGSYSVPSRVFTISYAAIVFSPLRIMWEGRISWGTILL